MPRVLFLFALVAAMMFACAGVVLAQQGGRGTSGEDSPSYGRQGGERFAPGKLIVKLKDGATQEDLVVLNRRNGARTDKEDLAPNLVPGLHLVNLPQGLAVREAVGRYKASEAVDYAEPDFILDADQTTTDPTPPNPPEDTYYKNGTLWGLNNTGQDSGTIDADIDGPEAWKVPTSGTAEEVIVAVIDSGVDYNHLDLLENIWKNPDTSAPDVRGYDFHNNDADPMDDNGHGTHVAGTIAAANNGQGVVGVNWTAKIMPLKFLDSSGSGSTSNAIRAVDYAVAKGAKLSNNSWGGGGYSQALYDAINRANAAGSLFVAAAGNGGSDGVGDNNDTTPHYPSSYNLDNIIAVASTTRTDSKSGFSNYGLKSVDLAAPGASIYSTLPGGTYGSKSGTSMATPQVSGALSLLLSKESTLPDTAAEAAAAKAAILSSVDKTSALAGKVVSEGRLNVSRLVGGETPDVTPPTVTSVKPTSDARGVWRYGNVEAKFSEAMDSNTVNSSTFTLIKNKATSPVSATVSLSADGQTATLDPYGGGSSSSPLSRCSWYKATVTTGVKDKTGNPLAAKKEWWFRTNGC